MVTDGACAGGEMWTCMQARARERKRERERECVCVCEEKEKEKEKEKVKEKEEKEKEREMQRVTDDSSAALMARSVCGRQSVSQAGRQAFTERERRTKSTS